MSDLTPEAAIAEVRQYLTTPVKMFGRDLVEQLLTAHDALAALSAADRLAADAAESENDRLRGIEQHRDALWRQAEDARMHRNATLTELAAKVGEADRLREQLAAANERAETAWAAMRTLRKLQGVWDRQHDRDMATAEAKADELIGYLRIERAALRKWLDELGYDTLAVNKRLASDALAPDAAGPGPSATETAVRDVPVSADARTGVRVAAEPTEVRDQSAWCWAPNPYGPLHCGRLARHDGPHKRGEREWWDDAGQDAAKEAGR